MPDDSTLLAHLVPRLTQQVENAATDALGYILNKSEAAMGALNDLLQEDDFDMEPINRVETQVFSEDGSRPDMAGYTENNDEPLLLVEAKFWAAFQKDQAKRYVLQLDASRPGVLMFICPETRKQELSAEVSGQLAELGISEFIQNNTGVEISTLSDREIRVMLIIWDGLLSRIDAVAENDAIKSDISQLRGLAQMQDSEAFRPIQPEELMPDRAHRLRWFRQLVDDVVTRGESEHWINTDGLRATPQYHGYGRYARFTGIDRNGFWIGINDERWADYGDTPLWLQLYGEYTTRANDIAKAMNIPIKDHWLPIHLKLDVEYHEVLDHVRSQVRTIHDALVSNPPTE